MFIRNIAVYYDANYNLSIKDTEDPRLNKDVPPGSGPGSWNPGDKGKMPGTPFPRSKGAIPKRLRARKKKNAEKRKKKRGAR